MSGFDWFLLGVVIFFVARLVLLFDGWSRKK